MNYPYVGCKINNTITVNELITMSKQQFSDGYFFKGESHNFYEVVCVLEGNVGITAGKNVFVLGAAQLAVHRPLEFHAIWEHGNSHPKCIIFSFSASLFPSIGPYIYNISDELIREIEDIYRQSNEIFLIAPSDAPSAENTGKTEFDNGVAVTEIKSGMQNAACRFCKRLEIFLSEALDTHSDTEASQETPASENYARILEIMEERVDENITVSELARLCGMSVPLVEKTMYRYLRCGAMSYYNNLRMAKAHQLLLSGKSVKSVALTLNFSTQNYFSTSFKKHFGYSPSSLKSK